MCSEKHDPAKNIGEFKSPIPDAGMINWVLR
jgi:hypothetical protein